MCCLQPFDIGADYCGQHDINHPIVGVVPVSRDASITWRDVTVTSLAVAVTTAQYTVAFVAMDDGTVRKVRPSKLETCVGLVPKYCTAVRL